MTKPAKFISTHKLAQMFSTSGDNIIRDLAKVGLMPRKTTLVGGRQFRKWDREAALAKLQEVRSDRIAAREMRVKMAGTPPAEAAAAKVEAIATPLAVLVKAQSEQIAALSEQINTLTGMVTTLSSQLEEFFS